MNTNPIKLGWKRFPAIVNDGIEASPAKLHALNDDNGQIVGIITVESDKATYVSHMPKSFGEQRSFINEQKAKEWVIARYAEKQGKPEAPQLPVENAS